MADLFDALDDAGAEVDDTIDRLMGDEELYEDYLKQLKDNQNVANLRKAIDEGNCDQAMKEVHTLKGVALNLGLLPLVDVCMDMLLDFRAGKNEEAMSQMDTVENEFNKWVKIIADNQ